MDKEQIKKIVNNPPKYDDSREDTMWSYLKDFYSKKMRWVTIGVYVQYTILLAIIIFSAIKFFKTDQTGNQIMYAVIFICCSHWMGFVSVFAWVMVQRPRVNREINRLELRIAELIEAIRDK